MAKARKAELAPFRGSRLPAELDSFLSRDTYSLMIKGESGTGKTILALTILRALLPLENVLYISTRTSPLQLFEYYPWIDEIFGTQDRDGTAKAGEGIENVVDSRLDEPNAVFERITNVLMDKQAPTVVIDSWEALGDSLGADPLKTDLRVLETWRERAGARIIFIGEDPSNTTLDHLVEGVVVLKEGTVDGRRLREITLSKLHGVQIRRPTYYFTLDGGEFRTFPEYASDDFTFRKPLPVRLDRPARNGRGRLPTGHGALDEAMKGGIPREGVTLIGLGEGVDYRVALVLLANLVQRWTASGGRVSLRPPKEADSGFIAQFAKAYGRGGRAFAAQRSGGSSKEPVLTIATQEVPPKATKTSRAAPVVVVARNGGDGRGRGASSHLEVSLIEGTLFVRGELPWTPLFGVVSGSSAGNPTIYLEPVV